MNAPSRPFRTDRPVTRARRWLARVMTVVLSLPGSPLLAAPPVAADGRTQVDVSPNGVPVVDIAAPNAAGVSHNRYQNFDVDRQGLVLNNSTEVQRSVLAGTVRENANLQGRAAAIILNEVVAANRSQLDGYIEIHGQRAELVIANPYGITCDGCGFINTPRVTLTTGLPTFEQDGRLGGFQIRQGDILVGANGADASESAWFDLLTRTLRVDGPVWAQALAVTTGRFDQTYAGRATTVSSDGAGAPTVSIDVSALGGMYANRIRLMSTEDGVGVRVRGDMAATVDDVVIDAAGRLSLAGRVSAARDIVAQSRGALDTGRTGATGNESFVFAGGALSLSSQGTLDLGDGLIGGEAALKLSGAALDDRGAASAERYSAGDIDIEVAGRADITAARWDAGGGLRLQAADVVALAGGVLTSRGADGVLSVSARAIDVDAARLRAVNDVTLDAREAITLAEADEAGIAAGRDVMLDAASATLAGGVEAGRDIRATASGVLDGRQTSWLASGRDLALAADVLQQQGAQWSASATARLRARSIALAGQTVGTRVDADARDTLMLGDEALVYGVNDVVLAAELLRLDAGTVYAGRDASLAGRGSLVDSGPGQRVAGRTLSVASGQDLVIAAGQRYDAGSALSLHAARDLVLGGEGADSDAVLLSSGGSLTLDAGRDFTVTRHARAVANGALEASAGRLLSLRTHAATDGIQDYALGAGGDAVLRFTLLGEDETFTGAVATGGDLTLVQRGAGRDRSALRFVSGSRLDVGGTLRAERDDGGSGSMLEVYLESGAVWAADAFQLELARLDIQTGAIFRGGAGRSDITLNQLCSSGIFSADCAEFTGVFMGSATTRLTVYGDFVNAGRVGNAETWVDGADSHLDLRIQGSFTNTASGLVAASDRLSIAVGDDASLRNEGLIYSSGNMMLGGGRNVHIVNDSGATLLMGGARRGRDDNRSVIGGTDAEAATRSFANHGRVEAVDQDVLIQVGSFINAFASRPATHFVFDTSYGQRWFICPDRLANCRFTGNAYVDPATVFYPRPRETGDPLSASPTWDRDDQIGWNIDLRGDASNQDSGFFPIYAGGKENYYAGQKAYFVQDLGEVRQDWYVVQRYQEVFSDPAAVAAATPTVAIEGGNLVIRTDAGRNEGGLLSTTNTMQIEGLTASHVSSFANTSLLLASHEYRQEVIRKYGCATDGLVGSVCDKLNWLGKSSYLTGYSDTVWRDFTLSDVSHASGVSGTVKAFEIKATVGNFTNTGTGSGVSTESPVIEGVVGARGIEPAQRQQVAATGPSATSLTLPGGSNGRFVTARDPSAGYLVETNPLLISFDNPYLGSDYLMRRLGLQPENYLLRFGDAAYEARLIREQVQAQTGAALLRTAYSDYQQQSILMDNAVAEAARLQLNLGTALSAGQVAALKQDIVWMVSTEVAGKTVLVPVVYLTDATRAAGSNSQVLAERAMIQADSFTNRGGDINANSRLQIVSRGDLDNIGGLIGGGNVSLRSVAGSINNITETRRVGDDRNYYTVAGPRGGIVASGNLLLDANQDINITGADVVADGRAALIAGRDVNVTALVLETRNEYGTSRSGGLSRESSSVTQTVQSASGARVTGGQGVLVDARRDVDVAGSDVDGGEGLALLRAREGDVTIRSIELTSTASGSEEREGFFAEGRANSTSDASKGTPFSASGFTGYEMSRSSHDSTSVSNAGSRVGGRGVAVVADKGSVTLQGSDIMAGEDGALIDAAKDVNIVASYDRSASRSSAEQHRFGISADASTEGVMGGLKTQGGTLETESGSRSANTSSIRSEGGISVRAGGTLRREGAQLDAAGNIDIEADRIEDRAARNETSYRESGRTYEAGISAGVTSGLGGTVAGIASGEAKQVNISSPQSQVVIGGSGASFSAGEDSSTAVVTQIRAGGNVTVTANKDIVEEGTRYRAGGDIDIGARSYENRAAANTRRADSDTSSANSSLTVAVNAASEASATLTASGSNEKQGSASSQAVVGGFDAGRKVIIRTDKDLRLEGSGVKAGGDVSLVAGGALKLDQANDTASASSSGRSGGATVSVSACADLTCAGGSVAANARTGESNETSRTGRAVTLQSGGATTLASAGDMRLQGTAVRAGGNVTLDSGGKIDYQALSSETSRTATADGAGVQAGVNVGKTMNLAKEGGGSASVDFERVRENESSDTRRGGSIESGGTLTVRSAGDTWLEGTQARARNASVNVGGNLLMESAQSTEKVDTRNVAGGLSVSAGRNAGSGTGAGGGAGNAAAVDDGSKSFGFSAKADVDLRDKDNLTHQNALIQTTGATELNVAGDATLAGANIRAGGGVSGEIGGKLTVQTRTDRVKESATRVDVYAGLSSVDVGKKGDGDGPMKAADRFDQRQGQITDTLNHVGQSGVMIKAESSGTDSVTLAERSGIDGGAVGLGGLTVRRGAEFVSAAPGSDGMNIQGEVARSEVTTYTRTAPSVSIDVRGTVASALGSDQATGGQVAGTLVKGSNIFRDPDNNPANKSPVLGRDDAPDTSGVPLPRRASDDLPPGGVRRKDPEPLAAPEPLRLPAADAPQVRPRANAVSEGSTPRQPDIPDSAAPAGRPRAQTEAPTPARPRAADGMDSPRPRSNSEALADGSAAPRPRAGDAKDPMPPARPGEDGGERPIAVRLPAGGDQDVAVRPRTGSTSAAAAGYSTVDGYATASGYDTVPSYDAVMSARPGSRSPSVGEADVPRPRLSSSAADDDRADAARLAYATSGYSPADGAYEAAAPSRPGSRSASVGSADTFERPRAPSSSGEADGDTAGTVTPRGRSALLDDAERPGYALLTPYDGKTAAATSAYATNDELYSVAKADAAAADAAFRERQQASNAVEPVFAPTREQSNGLIVRDLPEVFHGEDQGQAQKQILVGYKVSYFDEDQRRAMEVAVDRDSGKLYYAADASRTPINLGDGTSAPIFVVDAQGRMFVHAAPSAGEIHHSSLAAGQPVALAGQLVVKDGYIVHIDNMSGHYQPTLEQLNRTRGYLKKVLGADLDHSSRIGVVGSWVKDASGQQKRSVTWVDMDRREAIPAVDVKSLWQKPLAPAPQAGTRQTPAGVPRRRHAVRPGERARRNGGCGGRCRLARRTAGAISVPAHALHQ
ncbi:hemagglutinin repeat-containing protein [Methyloversatilis thermotolerans]|uniref:hemagglutinin repeat-containing protein n=1 Tax=Methyloversatilis thermotolerans TaxID=1346290 RepID=UPI000376CCAC|nr:hemagglutinin repeat-containing protein [Methyloversatilis thermotolerans]